MSGKKKLSVLIKEMTPVLNSGEYVFVTTNNVDAIKRSDTIGEFKEKEGTTLILKKQKADMLGLAYDYTASWITLSVHSSLAAIGLTALFSGELAKHNISCNVIAGFYHDHIFVGQKDRDKAMSVLFNLSKKNSS